MSFRSSLKLINIYFMTKKSDLIQCAPSKLNTLGPTKRVSLEGFIYLGVTFFFFETVFVTQKSNHNLAYISPFL